MSKLKTVSFKKLEDKYFGKPGTESRAGYEERLKADIIRTTKGREFPRFIFSNPTNTKSKGPFIVHTIEPRFIGKVFLDTEQPTIEILENWSMNPTGTKTVNEALDAMNRWFFAQLHSGEIKLETPF